MIKQIRTKNQLMSACFNKFSYFEHCIFTFPMSLYFFVCVTSNKAIYWFTFYDKEPKVADSVSFLDINPGWVDEYQPGKLVAIEQYSEKMVFGCGIECNYDIEIKKEHLQCIKWKSLNILLEEIAV